LDTNTFTSHVNSYDARNSIAHGRDFYPGPGAFEALHEEILVMMVEVQSMILDCVRKDHYKA
jgi:hypothetical protein